MTAPVRVAVPPSERDHYEVRLRSLAFEFREPGVRSLILRLGADVLDELGRVPWTMASVKRVATSPQGAQVTVELAPGGEVIIVVERRLGGGRAYEVRGER